MAAPRLRTARRGNGAPGGRNAAGFTYFTVLILVAIMGAGLAAIGTVWHHAARRDKERELLFVGGEFRRAIGSYFEGSPGGPQFPRSLDDLLLDKRFPAVRRHLRKVYADPMTGTLDWGLIKDPAGSIMGVYSKAAGKPIKTTGFIEADKTFEASVAYSDWKFVHGASSAAASTDILAAALPGMQNAASAKEPAGEAGAAPIAAPSDTTATRDDPAREARRPACEKQRASEIAVCENLVRPGTQNPAAVGCAAAATQRFNSCLDGGAATPASATPG